jgi:hypothetical protein
MRWQERFMAAINRFVLEKQCRTEALHLDSDPGKIIQTVRRRHQALDSIH